MFEKIYLRKWTHSATGCCISLLPLSRLPALSRGAPQLIPRTGTAGTGSIAGLIKQDWHSGTPLCGRRVNVPLSTDLVFWPNSRSIPKACLHHIGLLCCRKSVVPTIAADAHALPPTRASPTIYDLRNRSGSLTTLAAIRRAFFR